MPKTEANCSHCKHSRSLNGELVCSKSAPGPNGYPKAELICQEFVFKRRDFIRDADCCANCANKEGWSDDEYCRVFTVVDTSKISKYSDGVFVPNPTDICDFYEKRSVDNAR